MSNSTMEPLFAELNDELQQEINNYYHRDLPFLPELQVIQKLLVEYEFYRNYFDAGEFEEFGYYTEHDPDRYEEDTDRLIAFLYGPEPNLQEDEPLEYLPEPQQEFLRNWDNRIYNRENVCDCTACGRPLQNVQSFFKEDQVVCVWCYEIDEPFNYTEYKEMISTKLDEELRQLVLTMPTKSIREKQAILDVLRDRNDSDSDSDGD